MLMKIEEIESEGNTQIRVGPDFEAVEEYMKAMEEGAVFPPVDVFFDGTVYWLADGFHRFDAAMQAGFTEIDVTVHQGDRSDAILFSAKVNQAHGVRLTTADKQQMVKLFLEDETLSKLSNNEIAKLCGVSSMTISRHKEAIYNNVIDKPTVKEVKRNGKAYEVNTANIGKTAKKAEPKAETPTEKPPVKPLEEKPIDQTKHIMHPSFKAYESSIERELTAFLKMGSALEMIKQNKLYEGLYPSFEAYCQERWNLEKPVANYLIKTAEEDYLASDN